MREVATRNGSQVFKAPEQGIFPYSIGRTYKSYHRTGPVAMIFPENISKFIKMAKK